MSSVSDRRDLPLLDHHFGLGSSEFLEDPYRAFKALREISGVVWHPRFQMWLVARHEDCVSVLGDPRFGKECAAADRDPQGEAEPISDDLHTLLQMRDKWFLRRDPPEHTRLRGLIGHSSLAGSDPGVRSFIQLRVDALLDQVEAAGAMEVIGDLAAPLPTSVILHILGIPISEIDILACWSHRMMRFAEPECDKEEWVYGSEHNALFLQRLRQHLRARRVEPRRGNLLDHLFIARDRDRLDDEELLATCTLILFGGSGTTRDLIGNAVFALLEHPDEMARLRRDPSLIGAAVDEAARYDPPLQMCTRVAQEDVWLGDQRIHRGEWVGVLLGSACRDSRRFANADAFSLARARKSHLAFGYGQHFCPGMRLAKQEAIHALGALIQRMPNLSSAPRRVRRRAFVFRGFSKLPVRIG